MGFKCAACVGVSDAYLHFQQDKVFQSGFDR